MQLSQCHRRRACSRLLSTLSKNSRLSSFYRKGPSVAAFLASLWPVRVRDPNFLATARSARIFAPFTLSSSPCSFLPPHHLRLLFAYSRPLSTAYSQPLFEPRLSFLLLLLLLHHCRHLLVLVPSARKQSACQGLITSFVPSPSTLRRRNKVRRVTILVSTFVLPFHYIFSIRLHNSLRAASRHEQRSHRIHIHLFEQQVSQYRRDITFLQQTHPQHTRREDTPFAAKRVQFSTEPYRAQERSRPLSFLHRPADPNKGRIALSYSSSEPRSIEQQRKLGQVRAASTNHRRRPRRRARQHH